MYKGWGRILFLIKFYAIASISVKIAAQHDLDIESIHWSRTDEPKLHDLEKSHLVCGLLRRERLGETALHQLLKFPKYLHSRPENRIPDFDALLL